MIVIATELGTAHIGLVVALVALAVAFENARRNNTIVLRLRAVECVHRGCDENEGEPFNEFTITMQNLGIPIHQVHVALQFRALDGFGRMSFRLNMYDPITKKPIPTPEPFLKGMIAIYGLKSYELSPDETRFLAALRNFRAQDADLAVFAQGYFIKRYRLGGFKDCCLAYWNWVAVRVNRWFERKVSVSSGRTAIAAPQVIKVWARIGPKLSDFVAWSTNAAV